MPNYRLERGSLQWQFAESRAKIQIFGGGFANGKTTAAVVTKALRLAKDYPGSNGLIARETYPKLNDTIRKEVYKWCPKHWIKKMPTQEDNTLYLTNGSIINFRYIAQRGKMTADGTTSSNLLSATYDWIVVDQIEDPGITHKDFLDLAGRLRGTTPYRPPAGEQEDPSMPSSGPRWLVLTANPSPNWFFKEVVQPYLIWKKSGVKKPNLLVDPDTGTPLIELFEGSTYTNAANLTRDYMATLESLYRGQQKERYLEGKYVAYEGLVYSEYSRERNVLTREQFLHHLTECLKRHVRIKIVEAYDFGLTSPSCYGLSMVDDWGRVILFDGFYRRNFHYTEQPDAIAEIREKYTHYDLDFSRAIEADPAIFKPVVIAGLKDTGATIAKIYRDEYHLHMRPANNDIVQGLAKVSGYLNGRFDIPHPITGELKSSLLYVVDDLEDDFFESEITNYYWKRNPAGQAIDEPADHQNDHAMDMTKYLLSHLPKASDIEVPSSALPPEWMFWREVDETEDA